MTYNRGEMPDEQVPIFVDTNHSYQRIDGFGANIDANGHWRDDTLVPTLDTLLDDLGATIFRLDPFGMSDWVGDDQPAGFDDLGNVYGSSDFRDAWVGRHLEDRGTILLLNVGGPVRRRMCAPDGVTLADVNSCVEMLVSLGRWAVREGGLFLPYFGALNETDIGPPEGPFVSPETACAVVQQLRKRLPEIGLTGNKMVAFDQGRFNGEGPSPTSLEDGEVLCNCKERSQSLRARHPGSGSPPRHYLRN